MFTMKQSRPRVKAGKRQPRPAPACPCCGDQFTIFERVDLPGFFMCVSCNSYIRESEARRAAATSLDWQAVLSAGKAVRS